MSGVPWREVLIALLFPAIGVLMGLFLLAFNAAWERWVTPRIIRRIAARNGVSEDHVRDLWGPR